MTDIRHGLCIGGPRNGTALATRDPGVVHHADDAGGYYVWKTAVGPTPARWLWITKKEKTDGPQDSSR